MRKKTHEEYVNEVKLKNPNIEVIGKYINAKTKIEHYCLKHKIYWESTPENILKGKGCSECCKEKNISKRFKNQEEYIEELKKINSNIVILGKYVNLKTPVLHKCLIDSYEWETSPSNILSNKGCPKCAGNNKKTHEEYVSELLVKNPTIKVVGKYVNAKTKILHQCLIHDIYWEVFPSNALKGKGCKECMKDKNRTKFTKSHKDYIIQVKNVNPNVEVIENYIDCKTAILHLCKNHNVKWKAIPSNILKGQGCFECKKEKIINSNLKPHEDYIIELSNHNPHIEVIEDYIDCKTPILHYCNIHNYSWNCAPKDAIKRLGCPYCTTEGKRNALKLSQEEYVEKINQTNPFVEVVDKYININTKIIHHCLKHNVYWEALPSSILNGCGCYKCLSEKIHSKNSKTHEQYVEELKMIGSNIIPIEQYINTLTPILHKCITHDVKWLTTPSSTLQGCGCPQCRSEKISLKLLKTHEQYVEELKNANPNIIVLEQYIGTNIPILHKCLKDNNEWYIAPTSVLNGYGCPQCNESKGERKIRILLDKYDIIYERQYKFEDCCDKKSLPFDFYLPKHNICIEYDGKQHYEPIKYFGGQEAFEITVKHDKIKTEYCKNNGILLLRIPYYKNVEEELNNFLFI